MMYHKEDQTSSVRKMVFHGRGKVTVNPDLAIIRLGVQTTGESVTLAQADNARISQQILEALKKFGSIEIKTYQYQIEKLYDFENGNRIDRGYSVRNIYEIRTSNVGQVGVIIDTSVTNGANVVDLVSFDVASPDNYYQQALTLALNDASNKAKTIASGLRIKFEPVPILITEISTQPVPFTPMLSFRGEAAYSTPIESGTKNIEADLVVEFVY